MSKDDPTRLDPESVRAAHELGEKVLAACDRLVDEAGVDPQDVATMLISNAQHFACQHFGPYDAARWFNITAHEMASVPSQPQAPDTH